MQPVSGRSEIHTHLCLLQNLLIHCISVSEEFFVLLEQTYQDLSNKMRATLPWVEIYASKNSVRIK